MTLPPLFATDLDAITASPLGSDVIFGSGATLVEIRGVLTKEFRVAEDESGMGQQVWTTVLTVRDGCLPADCREGALLTVGGVDHVVRRRGRVDDMGAREYHLAERTS